MADQGVSLGRVHPRARRARLLGTVRQAGAASAPKAWYWQRHRGQTHAKEQTRPGLVAGSAPRFGAGHGRPIASDYARATGSWQGQAASSRLGSSSTRSSKQRVLYLTSTEAVDEAPAGSRGVAAVRLQQCVALSETHKPVQLSLAVESKCALLGTFDLQFESTRKHHDRCITACACATSLRAHWGGHDTCPGAAAGTVGQAWLGVRRNAVAHPAWDTGHHAAGAH